MSVKQAVSRLSTDEREQMILEHLSQVRLIARRIHERLPESVSLDDLISTGIVGLISAIDHFDPVHNVKLKTYAEYKIRGAILDSLRGMDWAPRQQRKRVKMIEAAIASLEQLNHRAPSEDEIAGFLEVVEVDGDGGEAIGLLKRQPEIIRNRHVGEGDGAEFQKWRGGGNGRESNREHRAECEAERPA